MSTQLSVVSCEDGCGMRIGFLGVGKADQSYQSGADNKEGILNASVELNFVRAAMEETVLTFFLVLLGAVSGSI